MKKILTVIITFALAAMLSTAAFAIDLPDGDILGYWKLDGNLNNEVSTASASYIGGYYAEALFGVDSDYVWIEGVDGYAWKSETSVKDGIKFVAPTSQSITVMEWVKSENFVGWTPLVFWGSQDQITNGQNWIGVWSDNKSGWNEQGPSIGSCNPQGQYVSAICSENPGFEAESLPWTHIAMTIEYDAAADVSTGKLYFNGVLVAENEGFPYVQSEDAYIYFGVNPWNWPIDGYLDEVIIYNEALSADAIAAVYAQYSTPSEDVVEADPFKTADTDPIETEEVTTEAPADTTSAPVDDTTSPADDTTAAPEEEKSGCGSSMGAAAVVALVATLGCAVIKRH